MQANKIERNKMYEITIGKNKTTVKVLSVDTRVNGQIVFDCMNTKTNKRATVSDAKRFLKEIKNEKSNPIGNAAWTGFRKGELGSLTLRNFNLGNDKATNGSDLLQRSGSSESRSSGSLVKIVTIEASYSKRRREDTQILHPDLVEYLQDWLAQRKPKPDEILSSRIYVAQMSRRRRHRFWPAIRTSI